jgi:WD40 repeat protein
VRNESPADNGGLFGEGAQPGREAHPVLFAGYELLAELGRGGMGVVYKARQIALNRPVALKMLLHGRFSDAAFIDRFHLEAEAAAHLDHPNIVPIYEVGVHTGQPFYSMRLIEGPSLDRVNAECGARSTEWMRRSAELLAKIARAVHYAHQHGVLHRDIKPHNMLIDAEGQPYLADFGLAKLLDQETGPTLSTGVIGSPEFMAPEQAAGKTRQVTTAADVYGLGAVLYTLLTGKAVFHADTPLETVRRVIEREPVAPRMLNPAVDRNLETICLKCLQKEPAKRYASAQALAEDLESWLRAEPIQARRATQVERVWLWCRRQPVRASLIGALMLVVALGLAGVLWEWRRAKAGELFARQNAYAADMNLAQRALANNDLGQVITLLEKHRPLGNSGTDLRRWEWRYLWGLCQSEELFTLHQYPESIAAMAASKDGKLLAVQTGGNAALWDLPGQRPIGEFTNVAWRVVAFSPTDGLLALGGSDERGQPVANVWHAQSRELRMSLAHKARIRALAFSPDGRLLATFDNDGNIRVTDWASGQIVARSTVPPFRRGGVGVLAFSPDGGRLAIGADAGVLQLLDWHSGRVDKLETQTGDGVTALVFSHGGEIVAAGFGFTDGTIGLWEVSSGKALAQLTNHTEYVEALAFAPDGRRLVSGSVDRTIRVWSIPDLIELRCFLASQHGVTALALLPDGKTLLTGGQDGAVCLWDLSASSRVPAHTNLVISYWTDLSSKAGVEGYRQGRLDPRVVRRFGLGFAPDSRSFVTTDREGLLAVYDARSLQLTESLPALGSNNWGVALSPDGRWLAAGQASGEINIWNWTTRAAITSLALPFQWFGRLRFSLSGRFLLAQAVFNDQTQRLKIWRTGEWEEAPLQGINLEGLISVTLSPDDRLLAVGYGDGAVRLWDFSSAGPVAAFKPQTGPVNDLRFSPDGRMLVSASLDGSVRLWDVGARRELAVLPGHSIAAWGAVFSPDGRRVATGGQNAKDAVRLWDVATQRELLCLPEQGQMFLDVNFSPDGNTLVATSLSGVAHLWRAPSWAEIEAAEKRKLPQR